MSSASATVAVPAALLQERPQSLGEEIANSISHGVALLAALVASPFLVVGAVRHGDVLDVMGACVFAVTMVVLYGTSMFYHALPSMRAARGRCSRCWTIARFTS